MNKLLASNNQPASVQSEYLREYLHIFGEALPLSMKNSGIDVSDFVYDVPLPIIDTKKVKLHLRDFPTGYCAFFIAILNN